MRISLRAQFTNARKDLFSSLPIDVQGVKGYTRVVTYLLIYVASRRGKMAQVKISNNIEQPKAVGTI